MAGNGSGDDSRTQHEHSGHVNVVARDRCEHLAERVGRDGVLRGVPKRALSRNQKCNVRGVLRGGEAGLDRLLVNCRDW